MPQYAELASKCLPTQDAIPALMTAISSAQCQGASNSWRIVITAVNSGLQVQLTEAAFMLGSDQLGAGMVAPVISPAGTNGQDPLFMNKYARLFLPICSYMIILQIDLTCFVCTAATLPAATRVTATHFRAASPTSVHKQFASIHNMWFL